MLLGPREGPGGPARHRVHPVRLRQRRPAPDPGLHARVLREVRVQGDRPRGVRFRGHEAGGPPGRVPFPDRPDAGAQAGERRRHPVPDRRLLDGRGLGGGRQARPRRCGARVPGVPRGVRPANAVVPGGGVPPEISGQEPRRLLPHSALEDGCSEGAAFGREESAIAKSQYLFVILQSKASHESSNASVPHCAPL